MSGAIAFGRTLIFSVVFYAYTVAAVLVALPVAAVSRTAMRAHVSSWARVHGWCARHLLGIRTVVEGRVPIGPALVCAKHQSMYETIELVRLLGEPGVVLKQELSRIPLWGWLTTRHGAIPVDRAGSAAALRRMLRAAAEVVAEDRAIMLFPEGTRVKPGETPPLRAGFAGLYRALGLPVAPVALDSGRLWSRGFVKRAGVVTMRFGEPIEAGLPRKEAEARVWRAINALEGVG